MHIATCAANNKCIYILFLMQGDNIALLLAESQEKLENFLVELSYKGDSYIGGNMGN